MAGGEIPSQGYDAHEYHAEGEAEAVAAEASDPREEEIKQESLPMKTSHPLRLEMSVEDGGTAHSPDRDSALVTVV